MAFRRNPRHRSWFIFLGLVDAFVVGVVAGIFYSQVSPTLCSDVPCDRFNIRVWAIENIIRQGDRSPRYLAIGDSITEGATLPDICGRRPINAGIVGATVETFDKLGRRLADLAQPDFIIVALGTNDALKHKAEGFQARLSALISSLKLWPVIVVPLPPGQDVKNVTQFNSAIEALQVTKTKALEHIETMDGTHLTAASYVAWKDSIVSAASKAICPR
jgi:GDSL-like Lipase/Acylhydrolase family